MLAEFTSAVNEFAGAIGYSVIVLSVIYAGIRLGLALAKRD